MAYVAAFLFVVSLILILINYLQTLYDVRRKVKITSYRTIRNADGTKEQEKIVKEYTQAPGPTPLPILGNLATIGKYEVPFVGFSDLAKKFGDIYTLTFGTSKCLVVNNLELIREVLNQNGKFFGGRPDFLRFHKLFGGNRSNSLALCDWSNLQQKRRNLARKHCSPRDSSSYYTKMSDVGGAEMKHFIKRITESTTPGADFHIKPLIQQACANMFSQYMCSTRFNYEDKDFQKITKCFDDIFWEINQGYAVDFLPWLAPFYSNHMNKIVSWSSEIRNFILERIICERELHLNADEPERDFTDALLKSLLEDPDVTRDTIIYMLEDFLGGHSAIGNLIMLSLGYIAQHPEIGRNIQEEVDQVTNNGMRTVTLNDTEDMPYTMSTILEVLRYSSSPIVPHVATEDACIAGYGVTKGTVVFINNYELNTCEKYWDEPEKFDPERFVETVLINNGKHDTPMETHYDSGYENEDSESVQCEPKQISKTKQVARILKKNIPHFLPFSIGQRTCIGQNLVKGFSFIMLANIMQTFDVTVSDTSLIKMYPACVAVPAQTYPLQFNPRTAMT
ncbi:Cytochrome P450 [Pseudolycoriella hygida]|uniref:Cytochrome P450 n=1 Tax=Pseudolycoriella hygida TaxID=35572 RepID=A0A9Q0MUJ9_9DIPT|nr:Cytochrome P450 [Pseudolycoriella hygida]